MDGIWDSSRRLQKFVNVVAIPVSPSASHFFTMDEGDCLGEVGLCLAVVGRQRCMQRRSPTWARWPAFQSVLCDSGSRPPIEALHVENSGQSLPDCCGISYLGFSSHIYISLDQGAPVSRDLENLIPIAEFRQRTPAPPIHNTVHITHRASAHYANSLESRLHLQLIISLHHSHP